MKTSVILIICSLFFVGMNAQELEDIKFNKSQTHFFYVKDRDSLFMRDVKGNEPPTFITKGCDVYTNSTFRRWVNNDQEIMFENPKGLFVYNIRTSKVRKIENSENYSFFIFYFIDQITNHDNKVYFSAKKKGEKYFDLYQLDLSVYKISKIKKLDKHYVANVTVSSDGKQLAYSYYDVVSSYPSSGLDIIDLETNKTIYSQTKKDSTFYSNLSFNKQGNLLYRDIHSDNFILKGVNSNKGISIDTLSTKKHGYFIKYIAKNKILTFFPSKIKRTYNVFDANKKESILLLTGSNIFIRSIKEKATGFSLYYSKENGKTPQSLLHVDFKNDVHNNEKLVFSVEKKNPLENVNYQVTNYTNGGGTKSEAYLYFPKDYKGLSKIPLVVMVYGCYSDQYPSPNYFLNDAIFKLLDKGYAIARLNTRGICENRMFDGYGKIQLEDTELFLNEVSKQFKIDTNKIIAAGHSHGGTMVYYYLTHSNKFAAGLAFNGAADWIKQANLSSITGLPGEMGGKPYEFPEKYKEYSPIENIHPKMKPMFIVAGGKDKQIPASFNAQQFKNEAEKRKAKVDYLYFEQEGHLIMDHYNRKILFTQLFNFLKSI
jgi:dipeptidyl aminopeptidase/acylaminoacyl peptidase